jgi:hypothetical protein
MGKAVRNWVFLLLFCCSLHADSVEEMKKRVCGALPQLYGWCTQEKALGFIDLVLAIKPEVCVEIGVFGGRSLLPVASALKFLGNGLVIGIDPWSKDEITSHFDPVKDQAHLIWWSKVNLEQVYHSYLNMISQHQLEDYVITLRTSSEHAVSALGPIDILYIDGNHSESVSNRDVQLYLPKVRAGGYIWLNDSLWRDIQSSVDLLFDSCDLVKLVDGGNCILFKKR